MTYSSLKAKLFLENILMFPLVTIGKLYGKMFPLPTRHRVFLFFPNADIGGSPKVNIDISNCINSYSPVIVFSKKAKNNLFADRFRQTGIKIIDLHKRIDNKWLHFINIFYRGVIASWVHQQPEAAVLGGECIYFYKVIPHLKKEVRKVEVCHLDTWLNYSIGFINYIDVRVFSSLQLKLDAEQQYKQNKMGEWYFHHLRFIENAIEIPPLQFVKNDVLQVVFIGRGSPQKRVHLIAAIATQLHDKQAQVHFSFVGDVEKVIDTKEFSFCTFYGNVKEDASLQKIYNDSDVLIMTSAFEGLPIVVMEMMARGKIIITTAVNALPHYIHHNENGFLITSTNENEIVDEGARYIETIIHKPSLKNVFGLKSREIAIEKFSHQKFCAEYIDVLQL